MKRIFAIILLMILAVLPAALARAQAQPDTGAIEDEAASPVQPQERDWRDELGVFRVGIVSAGDIEDTVARTEPFRLALAEALKMRVEVFPARDFSALVDAASDSRIEYAVFSASAYALAWSLCECIEPLVVARSGDGTSGYRQVLIARGESASDLEALKAKNIAMIAGKVAGGGLLALHELKRAGLDIEGGGTELVRYPASEAALDALAKGEADAMIGWSSLQGSKNEGYSRGTLHQIGRREETADNYTIIWQSSKIPHRTHAIRKNLPAEAKTILRSGLTVMFDGDPVAYDSIEPVHGGGFVAARQSQYDALVDLMRAKGVKAVE